MTDLHSIVECMQCLSDNLFLGLLRNFDLLNSAHIAILHVCAERALAGRARGLLMNI